MKEYMTVEELQKIEKDNYKGVEITTDPNPINGYGTGNTKILKRSSGGTIQVPQINGGDSACGNRLPCGVCLLTNKKCPLLVEENKITVGDPPYPYSPFTWCSTSTKDQDSNNSVITVVNNED